MVKETLTIMASIAAEKSLVLYASDLSNEPHLLKAIRNEIKLASKSHFPNQYFNLILQRKKLKSCKNRLN